MRARKATLVATPVLALLALVALTGATSASPTARAHGTFIDAGGTTVGWAQLVEDATGVVHVNVHVDGLAPGKHGIHIHAVGACTPTFAAAGGHYNPLGHQHGLLNPSGAHAGDLPNLIVNPDGVGRLVGTTDGVTITPGPTTLFDDTVGAVGSSFIIHANEDDQVTDATNGNSGARIACAVIEAG
jgi:Cu-Zn family superoxide dismutase